MILRNFYNKMASGFLGGVDASASTFADGYLTIKDTSGTIHPISNSTGGYGSGLTFGLGHIVAVNTGENPNGNRNDTSIFFGRGSRTATYEDYCLEDPIASGLSGSTFVYENPTYNSATHKWSGTTRFVLTNTSASNITINEYGIRQYSAYPSGGSYSGCNVFLTREVLASPIVLTPNEAVNFKVNFEFTMPTV